MGRKFGWHSGKLSCKEIDVDQSLSLGSVSFGSVELDTILLNGRFTTSTIAGAALDLGATYAYGEAIELRYTISNWTGIGSSFKALYLRSEADLGGSYGLRCAEFYAVMDTSTTTGLSSLQNVYAEMLVKSSASNRTLTNAHCIEGNISIENQTGTLTLTNNIYCIYAKAQTGTGVNDYTKVNGIRISGRDDGTPRVFGIALNIVDPEATVCTWTTGISISTSCTTAISLSGDATTGISITSGMSATNVISIAATASTAGINISGDCTIGLLIESQTTSAISFGVSDGKIVDAAASVTMYGGNTTGDALVLQGSSADATQKITVTGASGTTVGGNLTIASTGTFTTGTGAISVLGDVTWGTDKKAYFRDTAIYINSGEDGHLTLVADDTLNLSCAGWGKVQVGGDPDWGAGTGGAVIDGTGFDWAFSVCARVDSGALATACSAGYFSLTVTPATHTTASSFFASWNELYINATQDMANTSNCASVWGQIEMGATVTTSDQAGCFTAGGYFNIITGATFVNNAAHVVNGVRVQSEISSTTITNSGRIAAFECLRKSGSYQDWDYGLYIANATTGIYLSAAITGINFAGAMTTAITVGNDLVIPKFLAVGASGNGVHWDGVDEWIEVYGEAITATMSTKTFAKIQLNAISTVDTASGRLEAFRSVVSSSGTYNVAGGMRALVGQTEFAGACTYASTSTPQSCFGVIASIYSGAALTATGDVHCLGLFWGVETGSSFSGEHGLIYGYIFGKVSPESIIHIWNGTSDAGLSYFLDVDDTSPIGGANGFPFNSGDVTPDSADATHLGANGVIQVRLGTTTYYIPIFDTKI